MARLIGIVTTARSDFGCLSPLIKAVRHADGLDLRVYATGAHFSSSHGLTIEEVRNQVSSSERREIPCAAHGHQPADVASLSAHVLSGLSADFSESRPDILVVLGDRHDMLASVMAAVPFNIPIAHVSGGEETEGVIDNAIRHAVTKLAHMHFPSQEIYGERLLRMGEEAWRITVTGEPGLDAVSELPRIPKDELYAALALDPRRSVTLFTYHPETVSGSDPAHDIAVILRAADTVDSQIVFTYPGMDAGAGDIITALHAYAAENVRCRVIPHLGHERFFHLLRHADCMVGNSSSGIVEAASFALPVVNIGTRQKGRLAPANVLSVPTDADAIAAAWRSALSGQFRKQIADLPNPYGDGHASARIVSRLISIPLTAALMHKRGCTEMPVA